MLDLPIWNFVLSGFITELDCAIFIDLGLNTNHLWVNWIEYPFHKFNLHINV